MYAQPVWDKDFGNHSHDNAKQNSICQLVYTTNLYTYH